MMRDIARPPGGSAVCRRASTARRRRRQGGPSAANLAGAFHPRFALPSPGGRGSERGASALARARACALRLRRLSRSAAARRARRSPPEGAVPLAPGRFTSSMAMSVSRRGLAVKRCLSAAPGSWHRPARAASAVVAQGQSTSLVRTGSVVRFHSTAPLARIGGPRGFVEPRLCRPLSEAAYWGNSDLRRTAL